MPSPGARTTQADPEDDASDGGQKSSELVPPGKVLERLFGPNSNYDPHAFPTGAGTPVKVIFKVKIYGIDECVRHKLALFFSAP